MKNRNSMKSSMPHLRLKAAILVVGVSLAGLLSSQAAPAETGPHTTVINTISNPVPVQLTGMALSTADPLSVEIKNTNAIRVVQVPSQPFQTNVVFDTSTIGFGGASFHVPSGKVLVIECVSVFGPNANGSETPFVTIRARGQVTTLTSFNLLMYLQGIFWLSGSQTIRIYAGPDQFVDCFATFNSPTPARFQFNLSGYLLDVP